MVSDRRASGAVVVLDAGRYIERFGPGSLRGQKGRSPRCPTRLHEFMSLIQPELKSHTENCPGLGNVAIRTRELRKVSYYSHRRI